MFKNKKEIKFTMKKVILLIVFIVSGFFMGGLVSADDYSDTQTINLTVFLEEPIAKIEINSSFIDFGILTKGYETLPQEILIRNTGSLDVLVQTRIKNEFENTFWENTLKLAPVVSASCTSTTSWKNVSAFETSLDRQAEYNQGYTEKRVCLKVDLEEYTEDISSDEQKSAELTFWIMPA